MVSPLLKHHAAWLVTAALLIIGCHPPPPDARAGGGELRVLLPYEPRSLDPNSTRDEMALVLAPNLFNKLVAFDADSRLYPDLAESWEVGTGGLSYTFKLRRGVHWHDGRPFTAADVRWTFERLAASPGLAAEAIRRIARVETPDDTTVEIRLTEPWAPFLATLAWYGTFVLPRHAPDAITEERPVGTGPFRLAEWVRGQRVVLVANRDFFRPGPRLDRVVYTIGDAAKIPEMLLAGTIDFSVVRPPVESLARLERDPGIRIASSASDSRFYCAFNLRHPALADLRVREAINRAIDRQEILDQAFLGYGAPAVGFYTPAVGWAYNGDAHVPDHDPERARALLAEAGRPALELELLVPLTAPQPEVARLLTRQLAAIGITLRPVVLPVDKLLERTMAHDFELTLLGGSHGPDPENLNFRFGSRGAGQFLGYSSPELDAVLGEGARTVDLARRARAYFRAQEILARDLPVAPLVERVHLTVFRRHVRGLPQVEARGLVPEGDYSLVQVRPGAPS